MKRTALIDRRQPVMGFDLGVHSVKLLQLSAGGKRHALGYGTAKFPAEAVVEGIIVDPEDIAAAVRPMLAKPAYGRLTARRVAVALPVNKVFSRVLSLPVMGADDLVAAVRLEAEQSIPVPLPDLYVDQDVIETSTDRMEVLMVAAPRAIVDSYMKLFEILELEPVAIESALTAVTRALVGAAPIPQTTLVADFGSAAIDLTVFDKVPRLTDSIGLGGDDLTRELSEKLEITHDQAHAIKVRFGMASSGLQPKVQAVLAGPLGKIAAEMKRVIKFYHDRNADNAPVAAVMLTGGSAGMPGLADYLTAELNLPVTIANAWDGISTAKAVGARDAATYDTAIGLARLEGAL